jgi:hypothetical protein
MAFALVFPGQGSQSVGMMAAYGDSPVVRATFDEASSALGEDLWACWPLDPPSPGADRQHPAADADRRNCRLSPLARPGWPAAGGGGGAQPGRVFGSGGCRRHCLCRCRAAGSAARDGDAGGGSGRGRGHGGDPRPRRREDRRGLPAGSGGGWCRCGRRAGEFQRARADGRRRQQGWPSNVPARRPRRWARSAPCCCPFRRRSIPR